MVNYFELHHSIDPKVVGVRNGLGQAYMDDAFLSKNIWYNQLFNENSQSNDWWEKFAKMPDYGQPIYELPLYKQSKLTDFIDASLLRGYIINDKARAILEKFSMPRNKYFEVTLSRAGEIIHGYWWLLYDLDTGIDTVNFAKSEFNFQWHEKKYIKSFEACNYEDYIKILDCTGRAAQATTLVFNENFNYNLDLWGTQFLSLCKGYASEYMIKSLRSSTITGFQEREPRCKLLFEA